MSLDIVSRIVYSTSVVQYIFIYLFQMINIMLRTARRRSDRSNFKDFLIQFQHFFLMLRVVHLTHGIRWTLQEPNILAYLSCGFYHDALSAIPSFDCIIRAYSRHGLRGTAHHCHSRSGFDRGSPNCQFTRVTLTTTQRHSIVDTQPTRTLVR